MDAELSLSLIVNPSAGGGRAAHALPGVEAALRAHGFAFHVERTTSLDDARALARAALGDGELAVAMGGDGLIGAVAGELHSTGGILGVLPGGRGNDFARKLGIPADPVAACSTLAAGTTRAIDVAELGGRTYLGIASAGLDSDVQAIANATRLPLGTFVYLYGTLRALWSWRPARWEVVLDGTPRTFVGYSVAVCNTGVFGGGMRLAPHADLEDGLLDVVLTESSSKARFLANLPRVFRGTHIHDPTVTVLRAREVTFGADRPFVACADGDPIADLPATVRVLPGALRVVAPVA
ncbi:MAG: diacylglycerol kinase family lipid kinase [Solirubrobacterales bacterium]|jgi:YegS/Rv2252/BmrU family lipid kinase|nr:diacylglycerol kinase family lipid kinase [Solirubrobacterales bacterium]